MRMSSAVVPRVAQLLSRLSICTVADPFVAFFRAPAATTAAGLGLATRTDRPPALAGTPGVGLIVKG